MDEIPTPYELASLAILLTAHHQDHRRNRTLEETMLEGVVIFRIAAETIAQITETTADSKKREEELRAESENEPRLLFQPHKKTDPAREYLQAEDPGQGPGGLPNLRKGKTVERKIRNYLLDFGDLLEENPKYLHKSEELFFSKKSFDEHGRPSYSLAIKGLFRFKSWMREIRRIEALIRKHRASGGKPCPALIRARLAAAGVGGHGMTPEQYQAVFAQKKHYKQPAIKIINKLRSINLREQQTS